MFKLIKLAFYCLIGYAIYEMYQGFQQAQGGGGNRAMGGGRSGRNELDRALNSSEEGRAYNLSGPGVGQVEEVDDFDGGRNNRVVGRGVITT
jgi:hypothetical protein